MLVRTFLSGLAVTFLAAPAVPAATYSVAGFSDTAIVSGLAGPTDFAFLPDGRILIIERAGVLRLAGPSGGPTSVALDMTAIVEDNASERGLLGIALHPTFSSTGYLYLYFTTTDGTTRNRISRFTMTGSTIALASQAIILDHISSENGNHNGGTIAIGPDGKLWAAPGDSGTGGAKAQNLAPFPYEGAFSGKVLRMELDGSPAAGNPYIGDGTKEPRIWAYGLRNPFRFSFRPGNGALFLGDVGEVSREEIDAVPTAVAADRNYGWPMAEGNIIHTPPCTGCIPPVFDYPRSVGTTVIGGVFVTGNAYPASLQGKYVFGDEGASWIRYLEIDAGNALVGGLQNLATSAEGPVAFHQGPDGNLYYAAIHTGRIYRIDYARQFHTVAPCRIIDTRGPAGSVGGPRLTAGADRVFPIGSRCGVPPTARAVAVNLTVTDPTAVGHLTIFPAGGAPPLASAINFRAGLTRANNAVLMLGASGEIVVRAGMASGGVHFILDVTGFFD